MRINKKAFQLLLEENGLTRYELSNMLGIDRTNFYRLMRGEPCGMKIFNGFRRAFPDLDYHDYFIMDVPDDGEENEKKGG